MMKLKRKDSLIKKWTSLDVYIYIDIIAIVICFIPLVRNVLQKM